MVLDNVYMHCYSSRRHSHTSAWGKSQALGCSEDTRPAGPVSAQPAHSAAGQDGRSGGAAMAMAGGERTTPGAEGAGGVVGGGPLSSAGSTHRLMALLTGTAGWSSLWRRAVPGGGPPAPPGHCPAAAGSFLRPPGWNECGIGALLTRE